MARRPVLEFWYEFASTYSYIAAFRIEELAVQAGLDVRWRPFLLGPIFATQGWTSSPFNLYPVKGRYMWRDVEREAGRYGLPFRRPDPFPQYGADHPWGPTFTKAVYRLEFGEGRSIAETAAVAGLLTKLGLDADGIVRAAQGEPNKTRLKAVTEEARSRGLFGAPSFVTEDGELFWGNDRLEQAIAWAAGERFVAGSR
jgi:2-hydroxychromene-2-carboxylate isomerase